MALYLHTDVTSNTIMKTSKIIILSLSFLLFNACNHIQMLEEKSNMEFICKNIKASDFEIKFVNEIN